MINKTVLSALALTLVAAVVVTTVNQRDSPQAVAEPPVVKTVTAMSLTAPKTVAQTEPIGVDADGWMPVSAILGAPETEIVDGLEVRKDRKCTVESLMLADKHGNEQKVYRCVPWNLPTPRAYEHYDTESLYQMAHNDAQASYELGYRLMSTDRLAGIDFYLRSAALDPDGHGYSIAEISSLYPRDGTVSNARKRYVFSKLRERVEPGTSAEVEYEYLLEVGATDEDIVSANEVVDAYFAVLADVRTNVVGDNSWQGRVQ